MMCQPNCVLIGSLGVPISAFRAPALNCESNFSRIVLFVRQSLVSVEPSDPPRAPEPVSMEVLFATSANFSNNPPNGSYYTLSTNGTFTICATRGAANNFTKLIVYYRVRDDEGLYSAITNVTITLTLT